MKIYHFDVFDIKDLELRCCDKLDWVNWRCDIILMDCMSIIYFQFDSLMYTLLHLFIISTICVRKNSLGNLFDWTSVASLLLFW